VAKFRGVGLSTAQLAKAREEGKRKKKLMRARAAMKRLKRTNYIATTSPPTTPTVTWTLNYTNTSTTWCNYSPTAAGTYTIAECEEEFYGGMMSKKLVPGVTYDLPDGAKVVLGIDGNYHVEDKDAKVTYKACNKRDFNPFINASDMLALFARYASKLGVQRDDVLKLPINLFVSWLIIEAAQKDGIPTPDGVLALPEDPFLKAIRKPKCLECGRFIPRLHVRNQFPYCTPAHAGRKLQRMTL
jgi:hypothetical protein